MSRPHSRKRSRLSDGGDGSALPPYARPRARIKRAHGFPVDKNSRLGPAAALASVAAITYERLSARDFSGAAGSLAALLRRYRRPKMSTWYFPQETAATAGCLARCADGPADILPAIARDGMLSSYASASSGSGSTRAVALVDAALDEVAAGRPVAARELLAGEAALPAFEGSCLLHLVLGLLSLALANDAKLSATRDALLADASAALMTAARLNPTAYLCVHSVAAVELRRRPGDENSALQPVRDFAHRERHNAYAQRSLLCALRSLPRPPRQEIVDTARALAAADPVVPDALAALREACAWGWDSEPPVLITEVAAVAASAVEHAGGDTKSWLLLASCLADCDDSERIAFWSGAGRDKWWPQHFFKLGRVKNDRQYKGLVEAKVAVAQLLDASIPYVAVAGESFMHGNQCGGS